MFIFKILFIYLYNYVVIHLLYIYLYNYVGECTVGVDVGDGTTNFLNSIVSNIVIVIDGVHCVGKANMNVHFGKIGCSNTTTFVGMNIRFCTIHDR